MLHYIGVCTVYKQNQSSESKIQPFLEIITCDPSLYPPTLYCMYLFMEYSIGLKRVTVWVKVFRIIPGFRILRLTFPRKWASKDWIEVIIIGSFDLFSVHLKAMDHLNLKMLILCRHTASFKIWISKFQDFWNFELSPMLNRQQILQHL